MDKNKNNNKKLSQLVLTLHSFFYVVLPLESIADKREDMFLKERKKRKKRKKKTR